MGHQFYVMVADMKQYLQRTSLAIMSKEIQLFDGFINESRGLKRSVVAVQMGSSIDLKFKVGPMPSSLHFSCSFKEKVHGYDTQKIKTAFALISVKIRLS
uniref:Uncharacterized protein n=1 Tax=Leersia perrieri TaxID=77586 RepID=A0A0D9X273_9ORYZ